MRYEDEISLADLYDLLKEGLFLALGLSLVIAVGVLFLSRQLAPTFEAEATVLAAPLQSNVANSNTSLTSVPNLSPDVYRTAAQGSEVVSETLRRLGAETVDRRAIEDFLETVEVQVQEDPRARSSLITLRARSETPAAAADVANTYTEALLRWDSLYSGASARKAAQALEGQIAALDAQLVDATGQNAETLQRLRAQIFTQLQSTRALEASSVGNLEVIDKALPPLEPVAPRPRLYAALAFIVSMILVYTVIFVRRALSSQLRDSDDLAALTNSPVLGEFKKQARGSRRLPKERINYLRTNLLFTLPADQTRVIVVTSANPGAGKSSISMSLAESLASYGHNTLLVDADLRKPVLAKEYGLLPGVHTSLVDMLANPDAPMKPAEVAQNLALLSSFEGVESPTELLHRSFRACLERWRSQYDAIVIDTAPVLPVADTLVIAPQSSGVVFAASPKISNRTEVSSALALLDRIGVKVLGTVATNIRSGDRVGAGYGGYGVDYGDSGSGSSPYRLKGRTLSPKSGVSNAEEGTKITVSKVN